MGSQGRPRGQGQSVWHLGAGCTSVHTCKAQKPPDPQTLRRLLGRPRRGTQAGSRWSRLLEQPGPHRQSLGGESGSVGWGVRGQGLQAESSKPRLHTPPNPLLFWPLRQPGGCRFVLGDHGGLGHHCLGRVTTTGHRCVTCPLRSRRGGLGGLSSSPIGPQLDPPCLQASAAASQLSPRPARRLQVRWPNLSPRGAAALLQRLSS